ncbi:MAG TPA: phytanoyl-CoA dioxygenase family protein [Pseudoxanthomonas sp.]
MSGTLRLDPADSTLKRMENQELRARIISAAGQGRYREALLLLSGIEDLSADEELERFSVPWRIAAFHEQADGHGDLPQWPPQVADPFPGLKGLPEIPAARLDAQVLAGAILHHGGLLVRGLLAKHETDALKAGTDRALDDFAQWIADPSAQPTPWFTALPLPADGPVAKGRSWLLSAGGVLGGDSPRMLLELTGLLKKTGVREIVQDYFGEPPALSVGKSTFRKVSADLNNTAWHQDGAFLGKEIRSVNLWLALSPCGRDASAIDLVPRRMNSIVETGTHNAEFDWCVGHGKVLELLQDDPIISPEFEAGDALLFDHMFLHRTSLPPQRKLDRWAIEAWMFAPSCYPMDQMPLVI